MTVMSSRECESSKENNVHSLFLFQIVKLHQLERSGKMPLKLSFILSLFVIIFLFSTLQCYMWHSILKQKSCLICSHLFTVCTENNSTVQ